MVLMHSYNTYNISICARAVFSYIQQQWTRILKYKVFGQKLFHLGSMGNHDMYNIHSQYFSNEMQWTQVNNVQQETAAPRIFPTSVQCRIRDELQE